MNRRIICVFAGAAIVITAADTANELGRLEDETCWSGESALAICRVPELEMMLPPMVHVPHPHYQYQGVSSGGWLASGQSSSSINANSVYRMTLAGEDVAR